MCAVIILFSSFARKLTQISLFGFMIFDTFAKLQIMQNSTSVLSFIVNNQFLKHYHFM